MITRDIVDMVYDDGLTPKELWSSIDGHGVELACEFCEAIDALQSMMPQETTCDWSGVDLHTISDHRTVDGRPICLPCIGQYSLEEGKDYER